MRPSYHSEVSWLTLGTRETHTVSYTCTNMRGRRDWSPLSVPSPSGQRYTRSSWRAPGSLRPVRPTGDPSRSDGTFPNSCPSMDTPEGRRRDQRPSGMTQTASGCRPFGGASHISPTEPAEPHATDLNTKRSRTPPSTPSDYVRLQSTFRIGRACRTSPIMGVRGPIQRRTLDREPFSLLLRCVVLALHRLAAKPRTR